MARKSWDQLSPGYRQRLERQGITREHHASGASLHKARGHKSRGYEQYRAHQRREVRSWAKEYGRLYGRDVDDILDEFRQLNLSHVYSALKLQKEAQELYHAGRFDEATAKWEMRDRSLPEWMFYYHGYFS